jgi:hypothetical protein
MLVLGAFLWAGCGHDGPSTAPASQASYTADNPPPILSLGSAGVTSTAALSKKSEWAVVAAGGISALGGQVAGSHYTLDFPPNAIDSNLKVLVRISEYSPAVLDFELSPHGISFNVPVTLGVDYKGTNADPSSPHYDGSVPVFFWFNPDTGVWEEQPGVNDPESLQYTVELSHFSRYALAGRLPGDGTADW